MLDRRVRERETCYSKVPGHDRDRGLPILLVFPLVVTTEAGPAHTHTHIGASGLCKIPLPNGGPMADVAVNVTQPRGALATAPDTYAGGEERKTIPHTRTHTHTLQGHRCVLMALCCGEACACAQHLPNPHTCGVVQAVAKS